MCSSLQTQSTSSPVQTIKGVISPNSIPFKTAHIHPNRTCLLVKFYLMVLYLITSTAAMGACGQTALPQLFHPVHLCDKMAIPVQVVFCLSEKLRMPPWLLIFFSDKQRSSQVSLHSLLPSRDVIKRGIDYTALSTNTKYRRWMH